MGRKVPEWTESQLSSVLGQPILEIVPTWARVSTWSRTPVTLILKVTLGGKDHFIPPE